MRETTGLPAGRLERWLGKPPSEWTQNDLIDVVKEERIQLVSLMHVGGDGVLKAVDFVPRSLEHLRDILEGGERADGSSLFRGTGLETGSSDISLRPRVDRSFMDPFSPHPTLAVLCGHLDRMGEPLGVSPDTIVRRAHGRLSDIAGIQLHALGEVEFFLGRRAGENDVHGKAERGYHATSPFVFGEHIRRKALAVLAEIGVPVKYGHSEVGYIESDDRNDLIWEQHEIELALTPLPVAADAIALTQWVLLNLARQDGMRLSFQPIVRVGHAGSGLHVHFSPVVADRHSPVRDEAGELTDPARWLIAGLVAVGGALMAFGNRVKGSFIRLSQGREVPKAVFWGEFDRSALIRIPVVARSREGRPVTTPTIEFRLPDGSAHPHLLLAGVAQAVVHGHGLPDLDEVLSASAARHVRAQPGAAVPVPLTFEAVARELVRYREVFEAGGVIPAAVIDSVMRG